MERIGITLIEDTSQRLGVSERLQFFLSEKFNMKKPKPHFTGREDMHAADKNDVWSLFRRLESGHIISDPSRNGRLPYHDRGFYDKFSFVEQQVNTGNFKELEGAQDGDLLILQMMNEVVPLQLEEGRWFLSRNYHSTILFDSWKIKGGSIQY